MYICVDFDGTIADHRYPDIGPEAPGAFDALRAFVQAGGRLILFTMRDADELAAAVQFCADNGVQFYGVNRNPDQDTWTSSPKAYGQLYIDDAAFGCPKIHPAGFARPCVDWANVKAAVLSYLAGR